MDTTMKLTNDDDERVQEIAKYYFDKNANVEQRKICKKCLYYSSCQNLGNNGNHCKEFKLNSFEENTLKILNDINLNLKELLKIVTNKFE